MEGGEGAELRVRRSSADSMALGKVRVAALALRWEPQAHVSGDRPGTTFGLAATWSMHCREGQV